MNRSAGDGHICGECDYCFRGTRPGRHSGWCERPGQVYMKEQIDPSNDACNMFKDK